MHADSNSRVQPGLILEDYRPPDTQRGAIFDVAYVNRRRFDWARMRELHTRMTVSRVVVK